MEFQINEIQTDHIVLYLTFMQHNTFGLIQVVISIVLLSFSLIAKNYFTVWIYHSLFIHLQVGGYLSYVQC